MATDRDHSGSPLRSFAVFASHSVIKSFRWKTLKELEAPRCFGSHEISAKFLSNAPSRVSLHLSSGEKGINEYLYIETVEISVLGKEEKVLSQTTESHPGVHMESRVLLDI